MVIEAGRDASVSLGNDLTLALPASSFTGSGTLTAATVVPPAPAPAGMSFLGSVYDLKLDGAVLHGSATLKLRASARTQGGPAVALLGYFDPSAHGWSVMEGSYDPPSGVLTAALPHFSTYALLGFDTTAFTNGATSALRGFIDVSDQAAQPQCPNSAAAQSGGVGVISDSGDIVKWCADGDSAGGVTLRIANNRHYAIETDYPAAWRLHRLGDPGAVTDQILNSVAHAITSTPKGTSAVIVPGGATIELAVPAGSEGMATTTPSPPAYLVDALLYGADTLAMTFSKIPGGPKADPSKTARAVALVFESKDCVTSFDALVHSDVSSAHAVGELFGQDVRLAVGCLGRQWEIAYGLKGAVGAFVVGLAVWLVDGVKLVVDGLQAAIDSAIYWRTYRIKVRTAPAQNPLLGTVWGPYQEGYGQSRPGTIFNGGDPTGLVADVRWTSWGGPQAEGDGTSDYVGPGQTVAGGTQETTHVVAFNLGMCQGKLMYQAIEWYYPQHGEKFDPKSYINICTGTYVGFS